MAGNANVERLREVGLFSSCTDKELAEIARSTDEVSVDAGREIVTEGTAGHDFYLIVDGAASVTRRGVQVAELGPGQYFGEMALLDPAPRDANVTATRPTRLLLLGQREFAAVLDASPRVARKLLQHLAVRLRQADDTAVTN
jgi:CRP-like cAMP-binding protein